MNKIKDLLKQMGASDELIESIVSEFNAHDKRVKAKYDEEFKTRLTKAKQICVEEFEAEKRAMARKVEIFLEAHVSKVDREARRQAAIGESDSAKTLRQIKAAVEGVPIDGDGKEIQAVKEENKRLRVKYGQALDEGKQARVEAERASNIAQKALERNKLLESKLTGAGSAKPPVSESRESQGEGDGKTRLEDLRSKAAEPKTSRKVLTESQVPASKTSAPVGGDTDIMEIANKVDETPAYLK